MSRIENQLQQTQVVEATSKSVKKQIEVQSVQNDLQQQPAPERTKMKLRAIEKSDLKPGPNSFCLETMQNSRQMKLYEHQHTSFHGLNHIRKANRARLIEIAHARAVELSNMSKSQVTKDQWAAVIRGVLAIAGGFIPNAQGILTGVSEAINFASSAQRTLLEAKKTPIQTQLDLLKGAEIPQLDEEQRNYARMVQELDACIQRLREMEMNTVHSIHQG